MIKVIRRHQKKFLAGLTIFSMVAFLVQRGSSGQGSGADPVYATIYGKKIYASDMAQAHAELQALTHSVRFTGRDGVPHSMLDVFFGPEMSQAISSKPEWFLMLREEADAANIQVSNDEVQSVLANEAKDLDPDSDNYIAAKAGVTDIYKILTRYQQVATAIKVSKPMRDNVLAKSGETLQMNLVQLNASDFLTKVAPPTTQQVQEQFNRFAGSTPHVVVADTNIFGFGYKVPLRSKVQYIRISSDAIGAAVAATKTAYEWEVAARKYYLNNAAEFSLKPVTTGPASMPTTMASVPQTYEQAHDQVLRAVRTPMVNALTDQVRSYIASTLNTDYQAYLQFCTSGGNGLEADSSIGARYSSFTYLSKLIDAVKSRFNVQITASETPDYSLTQIGDIPGVGSTSLASFVEQQAQTYLDKVDKKDPSAPAILTKPSPAFAGSNDVKNVTAIVFARLSEVLPSQAATDISGILPQVEGDVRLAAAYKLAEGQAEALQSTARSTGLVMAASASGQAVIPVLGDNALSSYSTDVKGVFPPLADAAGSFTKQAFTIMGSYDPKTNPHPVQIIALPEQGRLFVAQLTEVNAIWNAESYFTTAMEFAGEATRDEDEKLREGWFRYDAVVQRTGFKVNK